MLWKTKAQLGTEVVTLRRQVADLQREMAARKRVEEALGRQVEKLRHSTAELQERVACIAHDLQQPLFLMASALELLGSSLQEQLDAEAQQFLNYARKGAQQLQTMLDALRQARVQ